MTAWVAAAALAGLCAGGLSGCNGERIDVGGGGGDSLAPRSAGVVVATHAALESSTEPDGTYASADGSVTGTYDRATGAFALSKREAADAAPLIERTQIGNWRVDAGGAPTGADYEERLRYDDGRERSYPVELRYGPTSDSLHWVITPAGDVPREYDAELFDDGSWTMSYTDEDPATVTSPDASGEFVVAIDESWTGTYAARWDDGSRLDESLSSVLLVGALVHLTYTWDDAATVASPDETGALEVEPPAPPEMGQAVFGTIARYDETGTPSCFDVFVDGATYLETPIDCP